MKSPKRTPLNLTADDVPAPETTLTTDSATDDTASEDDSSTEPESNGKVQRPMSERRRRRLAQEKRLTAGRDEQNEPPVEEAPEASPDFSIPAGAAPVAYAPPPPPAPPTPTSTSGEAVPSGRYAYLVAGIASTVWIAGVASWLAFEFGSGNAAVDPLRIAVYALIALAPAGLALMLAHAVRQGASLALETRRARKLAEALVAPTALAAQQTGEVLNTLRIDIDQASLAAERSRHDMTLLREALAQETVRLNEAADTAVRTARQLAEQLGSERESMKALGAQLDTQAAGVLEAVERCRRRRGPGRGPGRRGRPVPPDPPP